MEAVVEEAVSTPGPVIDEEVAEPVVDAVVAEPEVDAVVEEAVSTPGQ